MTEAGPIRRRLPHFPRPAPGEALASWVDRAAADLTLARRDVWLALGLTEKFASQPVGYGLILSDSQRETVRQATGIAGPELSALLLESMPKAIVDLDGIDLGRPSSITAITRATWVYIWQSHACPQCLDANGGVWQLDWKVPWSFCCPVHRTMLVTTCPRCSRRLHSNVLDRRQQLTCCGPAQQMTTHRSDGQLRVRRHTNDICGARIADIAAGQAATPELLAQNTVTDAIRRAGLGDVTADRALRELRRLVPMALYVGTPGLLPAETADGVRDAFVEHCGTRDSDVPRRDSEVRAAYRSYSLTPSDPNLVAAAVHIAAPLAFADEPAQAWTHIAEVVRGELNIPGHRWGQLEKFWTPPPRHEQPMRAALNRAAFAISPALDGRARKRTSGSRVRPYRVGVEHVPALLWPGAWTELSDGLVNSAWELYGRKFGALALARMLDPALTDWAQAAEELGTSPTCQAHCYRLSSAIRTAGTGAQFDKRLIRLRDWLLRRQRPVNYASRREQFADLTDLTWQQWEGVLTRSGIEPDGYRWQQRRPLAAAWVWETVTGGDWHEAPALALDTLRARQVRLLSHNYVFYFKAKHLPKVKPALTSLATTLLKQHGLSRTVHVDIPPGLLTAPHAASA